MTSTYEQRLREIALKDDRLIVMTAENRAPMRGIIAELGPRFIDTGITEQTLVGAAAGLALRGRIPVAHALATFLTMRAFEFIRTDVGLPALPVKLVGTVPGFLSEANGPTHQALEDVALMRGIPNLNVFCPADEEDMVAGLEPVLLSRSPWYIRHCGRKAVVAHSPEFQPGKAEVFGDGNEVALLVYGSLFTEAWQAKKILEDQGVGARLLNLRCVKPLDESAVLAAIEETVLTVTIEDHFLCGGLFSILAELALRNRLRPEVLPLALDNTWFKPTSFSEILDYEGFGAARLAEKIQARLKGLSQGGR